MRFQKQKTCLTCPLPAKPSGSQLLSLSSQYVTPKCSVNLSWRVI